ncbi:RNA polymerase sigma factor [Cellulomonas composti]|uniref:DNA-directed RNA polymerase sigma-70 factor n=1 Tax=Cellulomonas composti TaxID=266130 RepID=A0A511J7M1_9CELL|nr:sigma-70 family RNA polymerase sigma factor [Cellulomonas composti]GEL94002.1 DNA-directed RNA polymerase sigma-70 factor [Cellulomonas composti]
MSTDEPPDDELLARLRLHPDAIGLLFERHARAVHRFLARRTGPQAADDLLAEVFVAATTARERVHAHPSGSALPWLYGIARNVVRAHLRRRAPTPGWPPDDHMDWAAVDDRLDALGRRDELRRALAALTPDERDVLLLVAWDGLTPAEAGSVLGISGDAARSRLARARRRAQAALDSAPRKDISWT